jgi:hypothetical protein
LSIALRHIKERRFIKNAGKEVNLPSEELNNLTPPLSIPNKPVESEIKEETSQTTKSLNPQTLKFWEMVFSNAPTLKERNLVDILLKLEKLERNSSNDTKMISKIFKAEYNGYIKQTAPHSHIWELANKKNIII